jgi:hypothetical protein
MDRTTKLVMLMIAVILLLILGLAFYGYMTGAWENSMDVGYEKK